MTTVVQISEIGSHATDAWSGEFPALAKAGQPSAEGAGGAVRSKSRSVLIDFREAHRINKVLTTLANRPALRRRGICPHISERGHRFSRSRAVIDRPYSAKGVQWLLSSDVMLH